MSQTPVGIREPAQVNGMKTDWTSLRGSWWGTGLSNSHLKSLSWDEKVTPTVPRGVHGIPLSSGLGFYTATAKMTVTLECWAAILRQFPSGYTTVIDRPQFSYKPYGGTYVLAARWNEARIIGKSHSQSQGQGDGLWVDLDVYVRYVEEDGGDGNFKCMYPLDLDGQGTAAITG